MFNDQEEAGCIKVWYARRRDLAHRVITPWPRRSPAAPRIKSNSLAQCRLRPICRVDHVLLFSWGRHRGSGREPQGVRATIHRVASRFLHSPAAALIEGRGRPHSSYHRSWLAVGEVACGLRTIHWHGDRPCLLEPVTVSSPERTAQRREVAKCVCPLFAYWVASRFYPHAAALQPIPSTRASYHERFTCRCRQGGDDGFGQPRGAVAPPSLSHPPCGSREANRASRDSPVLRLPWLPSPVASDCALCLAGQLQPPVPSSPTIEATAPRLQYEGLPGAFVAWGEPAI
jgi:hypothetical protein